MGNCKSCCSSEEKNIYSGDNKDDEDNIENIEIRKEFNKLKHDLVVNQSLNMSIDSTSYHETANELSIRKLESNAIKLLKLTLTNYFYSIDTFKLLYILN